MPFTRQITNEGALLVRPDRLIAWRSPGAADDPRGELGRALSRILVRPLATSPVPVASGVAS